MMLGTNSDIPVSIMGLVSTYLASFFLFCKLPFNSNRIWRFFFFFLSPLAGGAGLGSIHSRGRLGGRARAKGARRDKAAAADQEAGYGSLHAP